MKPAAGSPIARAYKAAVGAGRLLLEASDHLEAAERPAEARFMARLARQAVATVDVAHGGTREEEDQVGTMAVLDKTGDERLEWDPENEEEVAGARKRFADLKAQGYRAYRVAVAERRGDPIDEFDPAAERILMAPAMQGG